MALFLIRCYKQVPLLKMCRFVPTCSEYGMQAFKKYPFVKALFLTAKRILRCRPYGGSGHDPLP